MLYALVIRVIVHDAAEVEPSTGRFAHAVFLDLIRHADSALSERLHEATDHKPFTVSPLLHEYEQHPIRGGVEPGTLARLRFTILDDQIFAALMRSFQASPARPIRVGRVGLSVVDVTTVPGAWTGAVSLEDLHDYARADRSITLWFATPTSFSLGRGPTGPRLELFPRAGLIFGGLGRRWRALGGPALDPALEPLLAEGLIETAYEIRTHALRIAHRPEIGFIGYCRFEARGDWGVRTLRQLNALADFAFFTGVGRKTTMGMGQTRRLASTNLTSEPGEVADG